MKAEIGDDDELYIVDNNGEAQLFDSTGQDFENKLRVPLLEILKYPYLLLHERVSEYLGCSHKLCLFYYFKNCRNLGLYKNLFVNHIIRVLNIFSNILL